MAEGELHARLKVVAMAFLKRACVDLVSAEAKFRNMRSRSDVCAVNLKRKEVRVVEVKATRADYLRDKKLFKLETSYYPHCTYFYLMTPPGVVLPEEVPKEVGLLVVDEANGVTVARRPVKNGGKLKTRFETTLKNVCRALTNDYLFNYKRAAAVAPQFFKYPDGRDDP